MKIVVDKNIPFIRGVLEKHAEVVYLSGGAIAKADVKDADALIVRTRTKCNAALLADTNVRFIATATIGHDHIDAELPCSRCICDFSFSLIDCRIVSHTSVCSGHEYSGSLCNGE